MEKIVVTRYAALVKYMENIGLIAPDTEHIVHAKAHHVEGKHVLGVVPYWLAAHAGRFTEIPMRVPTDRKGCELTLEEVEFYALEPKTYEIREVPFE